MTAVVVGVDDKACFLQNSDQIRISSHVLAEAVCDLDDTARRPTAQPSAACDLQAVLAREPEFVGRILGSSMHKIDSSTRLGFRLIGSDHGPVPINALALNCG